MRRSLGYLVCLIAAVMVITACATTRLSSVWKDPSYQGKPKKVLVYAILKNPGNRRLIEDEFTAHLKYRGIDAVPGYSVFPGDELVKKEAMEEKLKEQGFDTLLLTRLTGEKKEQVQVPGTMAYQPAPYYNNWGSYYNSGYTSVYTPSRTVEQQYALAETNLYNVSTEKLLFTATSETWVGPNIQSLIKEYAALVMKEMQKNKIVP